MDERRQLAAIMFTDIVGYTALMAADESEALFLLKKFRKLLKRAIDRSDGEWLETSGDGVLASFGSAIDAVNCALAIQHALADEERLRIRVGIHVGDVIYAGNQVFGDGVNIASRIEASAGAGEIAVSGQVYEAVRNKPGVSAEFLGQKDLRNVDRPIDVYLLSGEEVETPDLSGLGEPKTQFASGRLAAALVAIAVLGVLAIIFYPQKEGAQASLHSVAVLPFRNMSEDTANEYFSDGLTEELLDTLTRVEGLEVASRTSSFSFKNRDVDVREIAETLNVASLLSGSVRRQGDRVRITAELVDGRSGMRLWSNTYDRRLDDIFLIQEDIAREIAGNLRLVLGPETGARISQPPTENLHAYDSYLQGLAYLNRPREEDTLNRAEVLFNEAVAADPSFAKAQAGLCQVSLARFELSNAPRHHEQAREYCEKALALEPSLVEVRVALGDLYRYSGDYGAAEAEFLAVLDENKNSAQALMGLAAVYEAQDRQVEAEAALRRAIRQQPGSWKTHLRLGEFMYRGWRYDDALSAFEQAVALSPDNARVRTYIGSIQIIDGDLAAAEEAFRASLELAPSRGAWRDLGLVFMYQSKFNEAIAALKRATEFEADDHWSRGDLADAYFYAGRTSDALMTYREARDLGEALLGTNERDWGTMARVAQYYQRLGDSDTAAAMIQAAREGGSSLPHVLTFSAVYSLEEGDRIAFVDDLNRAVAMGFPVQLIRFHPAFESVRGDPGFEALLKRGGGQENGH